METYSTWMLCRTGMMDWGCLDQPGLLLSLELSPQNQRGKGCLYCSLYCHQSKQPSNQQRNGLRGKRFTHIQKGKRIRISGITHHLMGKTQVFPALLLQHRTWRLSKMILLGQSKVEVPAGCNWMDNCSATNGLCQFCWGWSIPQLKRRCKANKINTSG